MNTNITYGRLEGGTFSFLDLEAIRSLLGQLSTEYKPERDFSLIERLQLTITSGAIIVARNEEGTIVGMVSLTKSVHPVRVDYSIEDVIVDEPYRRRGIGEALMDSTHTVAMKLGVRRLDLHSSRPEAIMFYKKLGYLKSKSEILTKLLS